MRYAKTGAGQQAFKDRSVSLSPRQRSAFILFDGQRSAAEVLASTSGLGVTQADIEHLLAHGMLAPLEGAAAAPPGAPLAAAATSPAASSDLTPQERYRMGYPLATQLTASLGLRGLRLNLAVEAAGSYEKLLELFPRIQEAVGAGKCRALEVVLRG